mmetsp:Transcript_22859/g.42959  ORF Transcript_22859/g.42959 Transcript_22859/m.42959 type:complete len:203 (-) Transcript_22859:309-917(-)
MRRNTNGNEEKRERKLCVKQKNSRENKRKPDGESSSSLKRTGDECRNNSNLRERGWRRLLSTSMHKTLGTMRMCKKRRIVRFPKVQSRKLRRSFLRQSRRRPVTITWKVGARLKRKTRKMSLWMILLWSPKITAWTSNRVTRKRNTWMRPIQLRMMSVIQKPKVAMEKNVIMLMREVNQRLNLKSRGQVRSADHGVLRKKNM